MPRLAELRTSPTRPSCDGSPPRSSSRPATGQKNGENVFTIVRRIGQAKATLAADYAAQLSHSVGKVVFFAKHIDVMDTAERVLAEAGLRTVSIRGEQTGDAAPAGHRRLPEATRRSRSRSAR